MSDLISRRKAFEYFVALWECIGTIMDRDEWEDACMTTANEIPSAQPEKRTDEHAETHASDLIDRQPSSSCVRENDTISRRMAIDAIFGRSHEIIKMRIGNLPSAQPERNRGKWIAVTEDGDVYKRICSCCGQEAFFQNDDPDELYDGGRYELSDFCPHCGADMREDEHEIAR